MRLVHLTPGAGHFHCGSCLRDFALVRALRKQGHDAVLAPLYLPHVLDLNHDEPSPKPDTPTFFGGVNVYLQEHSPIFRHTPRFIDRLFDAKWMLNFAAHRAGATEPATHGELTVSMLRGESGRQAKEVDRLTAWLAKDHPPDVVCLSNSLLLGMAREIKAKLNCAVVCTLQGEDAFLDGLTEPWREQAWQEVRNRGSEIDGFIAVSNFYSKFMQQRLRLPTSHFHTAFNGIDLDDFTSLERRVDPASPPTIGYLGRMCPEKGLHVLVGAFIDLCAVGRDRGAMLKVVGACTPLDEPFVHEQRQRLAAAGLADRATFHPNVDRRDKLDHLASFTVCSTPATFHEAFGLYAIEAMAAGVPLVLPRHAAFPELLDAAAGGVLFDPDAPHDLRDAMAELLANDSMREALGNAGRAAVFQRFSVDTMAHNVATIYERVHRQRIHAAR